MPKTDRKLVLAATILSVSILLGTGLSSDALMRSVRGFIKGDRKPQVMLWAWEARSDLRWADPNEIGVAFLSSTISLYDDRIWIKPRMQPLKVDPNTFLMSVVRLECRRDKPPSLSEKQLDSVVSQVLNQSKAAGVKAVQIDFDARVSQRPFYRALLKKLRTQLPADVELSMTALASWCIGDRWLRDIPADEVVPMFFSMGADNESVKQYLRAGRTVHDFDRQKAIGLAENSTDIIRVLSQGNGIETMKGRRVYLFSNKGWTKAKAEVLLRKVGTTI